jgi:hypothetical protein
MVVHKTPAVGAANKAVDQLADNKADVEGAADRVAAQKIIKEPQLIKLSGDQAPRVSTDLTWGTCLVP